MNKVFLLFLAVIGCPDILFSSTPTTQSNTTSGMKFNLQSGVKNGASQRDEGEAILETEVALLEDAVVAVEGAEDEMLQAGFIPGTEVRIQIVSLDNETDSSIFKVFYGAGLSRGTSFPGKKLSFPGGLPLIQNTPVNIQCSKGSYLPIYMKDEGQAGGEAQDGFEGPYCLSMWLGYPQVNEEEKMYVRYAVKSGKKGQVGIKIGDKGQCQIVALQDVKIL